MNNCNSQTRCWICDSDHVVEWRKRGIDRKLEAGDFQITDHRYGVTLRLLKCENCGFIFAQDDEVGELTQYYSQLDDPEYERTQDTRQLQMEWIMDQALAAKPGAKTLLDVGAGAGLLVSCASKRGLEAVGVEPSVSLARYGQEHFGVEIREGTFPHPALKGRRFDIVLLVDVIEHVSDPLGLVRDCRDALSPEGCLIVLTPDVGSVAARLLGKKWWHFRLAHVGYFSMKTLRIMAQRTDLTVVRYFRAKWFFRASYLAKRALSYIPGGKRISLDRGGRVMQSLLSRIVPLNLFDSWVVVFSKATPRKP